MREAEKKKKSSVGLAAQWKSDIGGEKKRGGGYLCKWVIDQMRVGGGGVDEASRGRRGKQA